MKAFLFRKSKGFSLPDLLVAMLITGILLSLVIPSRQKLVTKAKSIQAKILLSSLKTSQESYYYEYSRYSSNIAELDFEPPKTINNGGSGEYAVEILEAGDNSYRARAVALKDFDGDGVFDTWEVDQDGKVRNVTPD